MAEYNITPSKETLASMNAVIDKFRQMRDGVTGVVTEARTFSTMSEGLRELNAISKEYNMILAQEQKHLKNVTQSQRSYVTQTRNLKTGKQQLTNQVKALNLQLAQTKLQLNKVNQSAKQTQTGIKGLGQGVNQLLAAFGLIMGVQLFANIARNIFSLVKTFDSLQFALERITASTLAAAHSQAFLLDISTKFGAELVSTTNRWIKFMAAAKQSGLTMKDTEDIFRTMTKAAGVLGLRTDELQGIYLALEQMLSKGKVTTEELRRQLGERLPGAMGIMAAAMGVTISQLDKMLKKGEVLSADALPKFAKAVEAAYGIEQVEKVDTLVAAQNRLTTAWESFVDNVFTNSWVVKRVFAGLQGIVESMEAIFDKQGSYLRNVIKTTEEELEKSLDKRFHKEAQIAMGEGFIYTALFNQKVALDKKYSKESSNMSEAEKKEHQEKVDAITAQLTKFGLLKDKMIHDEAKLKLSIAQQNYEEEKRLLETLEQLKLNAFNKATAKSADGGRSRGGINKHIKDEAQGITIGGMGEINNMKDMETAIQLVEISLAKYTGTLNKYKLLAEESSVVNPLGDDDGSEASLTKARKIQDLTLELRKKDLEGFQELQKRLMDDEKENYETRKTAFIAFYQAKAEIIQKDEEIELQKLDEKYSTEAEKYNELIAKGKMEMISYNEWVKGVEEEKANAILLIQKDTNNKQLENTGEFQTNLMSYTTELQDKEIAIIQQAQDKKMAILKKAYNDENASDEDRKRLKKEMADLEVETVNLILQKKIDMLRIDAAQVNITDEYREALLRLADSLDASRSLVPNDDDLTAWQKFFKDIEEYGKQFADALGGIANGIFDSNIEKINAEIEATKDAYDQKIEMATGEKLQQDSLRQEKEAAIKVLEKKRLKEEQKKAKFNKAMALAEIAMNTAVAISKAPTEGLIFGLAMVPVLIALGAIQAAAVLAQPIPKYKDGGVIKNAHVGMINDGGKTEFVERGGEVYASTEKNALVNLRPGDIIHKDFDSFKNNSNFIKGYDDVTEKEVMMFTAYNKSKAIQKQNLDMMLIGIERSIGKGFKNVKINNTIENKIIGDYGKSLSKWN